MLKAQPLTLQLIAGNIRAYQAFWIPTPAEKHAGICRENTSTRNISWCTVAYFPLPFFHVTYKRPLVTQNSANSRNPKNEYLLENTIGLPRGDYRNPGLMACNHTSS
jgi:hypothetical protein